jgi:hypothetical protein
MNTSEISKTNKPANSKLLITRSDGIKYEKTKSITIKATAIKNLEER